MFTTSTRRRSGRAVARRRHGAGVPFDRAELERSGWRTTLEYRENLVRRRGGRLDHLEVVWRAEAERTRSDGSTEVVAATAHSSARAWSALRAEADVAAIRGGSPTSIGPADGVRLHGLAW